MSFKNSPIEKQSIVNIKNKVVWKLYHPSFSTSSRSYSLYNKRPCKKSSGNQNWWKWSPQWTKSALFRKTRRAEQPKQLCIWTERRKNFHSIVCIKKQEQIYHENNLMDRHEGGLESHICYANDYHEDSKKGGFEFEYEKHIEKCKKRIGFRFISKSISFNQKNTCIFSKWWKPF